MATDSTECLRQLLETLSQELYDQIYDETFMAPDGVYCELKSPTSNEKLRPPHLLHVDHASRLKYAKSYYGRSVFIFRTRSALESWLSAISADHRGLLKEAWYAPIDLLWKSVPKSDHEDFARQALRSEGAKGISGAFQIRAFSRDQVISSSLT